MKKIINIIQPAGFVLLLVYIAIPDMAVTTALFYAGILLSILGTWLELRTYIRTKKSKRTQTPVIFGIGIFIKILLILAIVLRIQDAPFSIYILLGCILLAIVWGAVGMLIGNPKNKMEEFLDAE